MQDVPTFYRPIGEKKYWMTPLTNFVYNFYLQSILISEEYLQKWWNVNLI